MLKEKTERMFAECDELMNLALKESINIDNFGKSNSKEIELCVKMLLIYKEIKSQQIELSEKLDKIEDIDKKLDKVFRILKSEEES